MTNHEKRRSLLAECERMSQDYRARLEALADDENIKDEEYNRLEKELHDAHQAAYLRVWREAFFLQFPNRRGWFADTFIASFGGACEGRRLSVKQTEVVRRYTCPDNNTWQTGETYCRAGGKMVTLCVPRYSNGVGYLTIR